MKNFRTTRGRRPKISVPFTRCSVASVALRATQYRGVQSNNNFASWGLCGDNQRLYPQGNPDRLAPARRGPSRPEPGDFNIPDSKSESAALGDEG